MAKRASNKTTKANKASKVVQKVKEVVKKVEEVKESTKAVIEETEPVNDVVEKSAPDIVGEDTIPIVKEIIEDAPTPEEVKVNLMKLTEAYLSNVDYSELEEIFKEHGVEKAFKGGEKKATLIQQALELYKKVQDLKEKGIEDKDEIENEIAIQDAKKAEKKAKVRKVKVKAKVNVRQDADSQLKKAIANLSTIDIEKNMSNINVLLQSGIESQRSVLLYKKKFLIEELENRK